MKMTGEAHHSIAPSRLCVSRNGIAILAAGFLLSLLAALLIFSGSFDDTIVLRCDASAVVAAGQPRDYRNNARVWRRERATAFEHCLEKTLAVVPLRTP
jgi:hypothetical protein